MPGNSVKKPVLFEGRPDWHEASEYAARRHDYHVRRVIDLQARSRAVGQRMEVAYATLADRLESEKRFMQAQRLRLDKELVRLAWRQCVRRLCYDRHMCWVLYAGVCAHACIYLLRKFIDACPL